MDRVTCYSQMENNTLGTMKRMLEMAAVSLSGQMGESTKDSGWPASSMEKGTTQEKMDK